MRALLRVSEKNVVWFVWLMEYQPPNAIRALNLVCVCVRRCSCCDITYTDRVSWWWNGIDDTPSPKRLQCYMKNLIWKCYFCSVCIFSFQDVCNCQFYSYLCEIHPTLFSSFLLFSAFRVLAKQFMVKGCWGMWFRGISRVGGWAEISKQLLFQVCTVLVLHEKLLC